MIHTWEEERRCEERKGGKLGGGIKEFEQKNGRRGQRAREGERKGMGLGRRGEERRRKDYLNPVV